MLEIRGIAEYKTFSQGSGKSLKGGENQGAEFRELLYGGEGRKTARSGSDERGNTERGASSLFGMAFAVYDGSGKRSLSGIHIGRNLDVEL
jgi:hypothetical protein